ncbi:MAG: hypothetical protein OM95_07505 [Bdellovibrio sp. ArHS]|uniref:hypothetical protein n=1 Tax=Bdellovibrio sp. ArHS TaxID=1569284 RepID=UPI00058254AA|nr:hypothetical protein [Bdellovibrio sp. ArHS]KHD88643.1 MAG: hypothetical protein OM95_07505 [Bdellovibrio sp. ArHS]
MLSSLLFLLFSFSFAQSDLHCASGSFRFLTNGVTSTSKSFYCYNSDKTQLYSKECKNQKCPLAFDSKKYFNFSDLHDENSNPGFNLCRKLDGKPEILEFQADKEWFKLDRCNFKDGSFVSTSELLKFYLQKKN